MDDTADRLTKLRQLTERQFEVLRLRCQGRSLAEIAEVLVIVEQTVKHHMRLIYVRLGLNDLPKASRQFELGRFCPLLDRISEAELPSEDEATTLPEPIQHRAELAVLEDEVALVQARQSRMQVWNAPPPEPQVIALPRRRFQMSGRLRIWLLFLGTAAIGGLISAIVVALILGTRLDTARNASQDAGTPPPPTQAPVVAAAPNANPTALALAPTAAPTLTLPPPTALPSTPSSVPPTPTSAPPTATPVPPTATLVPPTATIVPTSLPKPQPGAVLYRADWAGGLNGWPSANGWKVLRGMLLNDGSGTGQLIPAPYRVNETDDYAVEAEIQVVSAGFDYGIYLRDGYKARCDTFAFSTPCLLLGGDLQLGLWEYRQTPGWHTYRLEADGNCVSFLIDGAPLGEVTDNQFLSGSRVGLWSNGLQLNVRSFRAIAL